MKKQEIIHKLYNNRELTGEEVTFIARNLNDTDKGGPGLTGSLPYHHGESKMLDACSVCADDINHVNDKFRILQENMNGGKDQPMTKLVEGKESVALENDQNMRVIMMQFVRLSVEQGNPILKILGMLGKLPPP